MRFSAGLPTERVQHGDEFIGPEAVAEMARTLERAGFDACFVTDHPFPPDTWLEAGGHHTLDPFVTLSWVAAFTQRLRLHTNILVLPYRNPFLAAKAIASLDVLSRGRTIVGTAAGYLEGEMRAVGADFAARNDVADAYLRAMKRAWTESGVRCTGPGFAAEGNTMLPRPVQQPHPPLWVGGNSKRAIRRAIELADGWNPFLNPPHLAAHTRSAVITSHDDLRERVAWARGEMHRQERTRPLDICFSLTRFGKHGVEDREILDAIAELEEIGITWLTVRVRGRTRAEYCDTAARFGERIVLELRRGKGSRVRGVEGPRGHG